MSQKTAIIFFATMIVVAGGLYIYRQLDSLLPEGFKPWSSSSPQSMVSEEEAIKELFADKYAKEVEDINITITKETETHVRGMAEIEPGGAGNSGLFLAVKVDNQWELAFDGQGVISCEDMEGYGFPQDMLSDCQNTRTVETKINEEFFIMLAANPTTGYEWQVDTDPEYVELKKREYSPSQPELLGSGGQETFAFLALKSGETEIVFSYLRPWEEGVEPIEEKV
jgi:inhibitor of cysteine peptidase